MPGAAQAGHRDTLGDSTSRPGARVFCISLNTGAKFIESGQYKKVLVIGSDVNSAMVNYADRAVCIIFGDGAGAVLLEPADEGEAGNYRPRRPGRRRWRAVSLYAGGGQLESCVA